MAYHKKRGLSGGSGPAVLPAHTPIPEAEPEQELRIPNSELEQGLQTFKDRTYVQVLDMTPAGWEKEGLYVQIKRETTRSLPMFVKHKTLACFAYMIHRTGGTMLKRVRKGGVHMRRGEDEDDDEWIKASNHINQEEGYEKVTIPAGERASKKRGGGATTVHREVVPGMNMFKNKDGIEPMFVKHKTLACFAYMIHRTGGTMLKRVRKGGVHMRRGEDEDDDEWIKASNHINQEEGYEKVTIPAGERASKKRGGGATTVHREVVPGMNMFKNKDGIEEPLVPTMGHHKCVDHHNKNRADSRFHNLVSCTNGYNQHNRGTSRPVTLRFTDGEEIEFMSRAHASAWTGLRDPTLAAAVENKTVRTWMSAVVYRGKYQDLTPLSKCHQGRKFTVSYTNVSVSNVSV